MNVETEEDIPKKKSDILGDDTFMDTEMATKNTNKTITT